MLINGLLVAVGIELSDGGKVGGLLFADDFVGVSESRGTVTEGYRCGSLLL